MTRRAIVTGAASGIGRGRFIAIASATMNSTAAATGPSGGAFTGAPLVMDAGWTAR